jgi:hypothetical protein
MIFIMLERLRSWHTNWKHCYQNRTNFELSIGIYKYLYVCWNILIKGNQWSNGWMLFIYIYSLGLEYVARAHIYWKVVTIGFLKHWVYAWVLEFNTKTINRFSSLFTNKGYIWLDQISNVHFIIFWIQPQV